MSRLKIPVNSAATSWTDLPSSMRLVEEGVVDVGHVLAVADDVTLRARAP